MVSVFTRVPVTLDPLLPAQMFWARKPASKGPWVVSATKTGPPPVLLTPNVLSVAVGNQSAGPTAKVNEPGFAGVKKNCGCMLLRPNSGPTPGKYPIPGIGPAGSASRGSLVIGVFQRVTRFQSGVSLSGIIGSTT